jgi:outer membrane protein assembly factor BamB
MTNSVPSRTGARRGLAAGLVAALLVAACGTSLPSVPLGGSPATVADIAAEASSGSPGGPAVAGGGAVATTPQAVPKPASLTTGGHFPNGVLVADEGNGRLVAISGAGTVLWQFPKVPGAVPAGQHFTADDAFFAPDGKTIVANDEFHQVIDRINIATGKVVWQYGHYGVPGSGPGYLHNPDDAYPLANGNIVVADIVNCRILEIAPSKAIVKMWGRTGVCVDHAPYTYGDPNGDTPLPDGGMLITEIHGSRVVRLSATGKVLYDIHVPAIYPSDAQLDAHGNIVLADYANPGAVMAVSPKGKLLWRYAPTAGAGRLDHPSLATPLADGTVAVNDDFRHRVIVINPRTMRIVWQYGHTDVAGRARGYLAQPDGHQPIPAGVVF